MRLNLTTTLTALLLALPFGAMAEEHHRGPPAGGGQQEGLPPDKSGGERPGNGGMLERLEQFMAYAESKDGDAEIGERFAKATAMLKEKRPEEFAKLDTDGDGQISRAEAKAAIERMMAMLKEKDGERFAKLDADHDGKLSREEIRAAREQFHKERPAGDQPPGDKPPGDRPNGDRPMHEPEGDRRRKGDNP